MTTITDDKIENYTTINSYTTTELKSKYFLSPERSEECKWVCGYCGALHPSNTYKCDNCGARRRGHEELKYKPKMEIYNKPTNTRDLTYDEEQQFFKEHQSKEEKIIRELYEKGDYSTIKQLTQLWVLKMKGMYNK